MVQQIENLALLQNGASIVSVSSEDENHRAENILDGTLKTFWTTTGLYPQEFVVKLKDTTILKKIILSCTKTSEWQISVGLDETGKFEDLTEQVLQDGEGLQTCAIDVAQEIPARYVRFQIQKGKTFCAVHRLVIYGEQINAQ